MIFIAARSGTIVHAASWVRVAPNKVPVAVTLCGRVLASYVEKEQEKLDCRICIRRAP